LSAPLDMSSPMTVSSTNINASINWMPNAPVSAKVYITEFFVGVAP
jgi:hypothetical protein